MKALKRGINLGHVTAGFSAVLVSYTSSIVIVIQVATSAGVSPSQIESWLLTLGVMIGISTIVFSWFYKLPLFTAWSTPGAAMLIGIVGDYSLSNIVGAFVVTGVLIVITGLIKPLTKALERIPSHLGTAMLAAILLPFCLRAFEPIATDLWLFLCMFVSFFAAKHIMPRYAMLVLLLVGLIGALFSESVVVDLDGVKPFHLADLFWITPSFEWLSIINIALPLYLVTMLSQNLPGFTLLKSYGYYPPVKPVLIGTGTLNALFAGFGAFSLNLAAISAAICMNEDVDKDKTQRYKASMWAGIFYLLGGVFATTLVSLFLLLPLAITQMLAGFALLSTLLMCLQSAFKAEQYQEPALLTFLITLSGVAVMGVSSPLLGLLVGLVYLALKRKAVS